MLIHARSSRVQWDASTPGSSFLCDGALQPARCHSCESAVSLSGFFVVDVWVLLSSSPSVGGSMQG